MGHTAFPNSALDGPRIERVRQELKHRTLQVESTCRLTPDMLRITLVGDDLADFVSLGFDDHVKLVLPTPSGEVEHRTFTPRRFDPRSRTLAIDFAVHDAGPAARWAIGAQVGDTLQIHGPKGSVVIAGDVRHLLLVGDETALPAIGRRIEEAEAGELITSVVAVTGPEEHQSFDTRARLTALWAHRPPSAAANPDALIAILKGLDLEPGTFVWVAAEAAVTRTVRAYLIEERGHPLRWVKASGYWVMGRQDAHEKFEE